METCIGTPVCEHGYCAPHSYSHHCKCAKLDKKFQLKLDEAVKQVVIQYASTLNKFSKE